MSSHVPFFYEGRKKRERLSSSRRTGAPSWKLVKKFLESLAVYLLTVSFSLSLLEAAVIRVNGRGRRKPATTTDLRLKHRIPLPRSRGRNRGLINRVLDETLAKSMGHARILRSWRSFTLEWRGEWLALWMKGGGRRRRGGKNKDGWRHRTRDRIPSLYCIFPAILWLR